MTETRAATAGGGARGWRCGGGVVPRQLSIDDCLTLQRIDAGIKRIKQRSADCSPETTARAIEGMERNREMVLAGGYVLTLVNEPLIRAVGGELAKISRYYRRPKC